MEKKSPGKYILVFEPKYAYHQFALYFTSSNDVQITRIKKFTDLDYQSNKPVKKNLLGDIDRIMTSCSDLNEFFKKYVDPNVFSYYGYNLHNMFVAYKNNGKIRTLNYSINNPQLNKKLELVEGSKFTDKTSISNLINFAVDTDEKNEFLTFISERKNKFLTGLTDETYDMLIDLNSYLRANANYSDSGVLMPSIELTNKLSYKLTSYKEYRELYLLKQAYIGKLNLEKQILEKEKEKLSSQKRSLFILNENIPQAEQMNLFGETKSYQKTKKKH